MRYKRVLLKISGEALAGNQKYGIEAETIQHICQEVLAIYRLGVEVAIVVGGGNIHRGVSGATKGMDRPTSDYMGMLATVINALALQDSFEKLGAITRVISAIEMRGIAETYIRRRALRHLEKGRIIIFAAGTGSPYFTTDTTAALRANEINAEVIFKATKVDGIYSEDPLKNALATKYDKLSYIEALNNLNIKVMDSTAVSLCMDNNMDIVVFSLLQRGNLEKVVRGEKIGTLVTKA